MRLPGHRRQVGLVVTALALTMASTPAPAAQAPASSGWQLTARDYAPDYAPTFLGNGYLGERIPAAGMGYGATPVSTDSQLAGFYAQLPGYTEQRADIPTWSTLAFSDGSGTYGRLPSGTASCAGAISCPSPVAAGQWQGSVSGWRQTLDVRRALLTTAALWTSPGGQQTQLTYDVMVDQARPHVAAVRLSFSPHWSGRARVTSMFDATDTQARVSGSGAGAAEGAIGGLLEGTDTELSIVTPGAGDPTSVQASESVTAVGTGTTAALASSLLAPTGSTLSAAVAAEPASIGEVASIPVEAGHTYTLTKFVGISSSHESTDPMAEARSAAQTAARTGFVRLLAEHEAAWAQLWRSDITVPGDSHLQTVARASLFYLLESTRVGSPWSMSPAGLSSPGYNGHVFWDAETWMYPPLLATHPDLAAGIDKYRADRLAPAEQYAASSGFAGARFPWESATTGDEQTPIFANTPTPLPGGYFPDTGTYEQHITSDIALAQWQYYLATGDLQWLRGQAWPVLSAAANFWASRAVTNPTGGYDLAHVMGPDEYHADVTNSAYTNVSAATTLQIATRAAKLVGQPADPRWQAVAAGLLRTVPYDARAGRHPEYSGYEGQSVKQADVVMLQYPWAFPMPAQVASNDLAYYAARTDAAGPSMTDAITGIDSAALGQPGCADYWYLQRSVSPFVRAPFAQFAETRTGGAFTFTTGIGGFLQELIYGFSGLRWEEDGIALAPTLPPQLPGLVLHNLSWHGRLFTVTMRPKDTTLTVTGRGDLPVHVAGALHVVPAGGSLTIPTRRPDLFPSSDVARCRPVTASSADPSYPAAGATDGQQDTSWVASDQHATLKIDLQTPGRVDGISVRWGASRGTSYALDVSNDARHWSALPRAKGSAPSVRLRFPAVAARYVRLTVSTTSTGRGVQVDELAVSGVTDAQPAARAVGPSLASTGSPVGFALGALLLLCAAATFRVLRGRLGSSKARLPGDRQSDAKCDSRS